MPPRHARVQCVECHMGRISTLQLMALKPTHAKELWGMIVGYERPTDASDIAAGTRRVRGLPLAGGQHSTACAPRCATTPTRRAGRRERRWSCTPASATCASSSKGIHWHIAQEVTYTAIDPQKQKIPWVQAREADGKKVTYFDPSPS